MYNCVKHASIELNSFEVAFDYQLDFNFNWNDKNCFDVSIVKERVQRLWDDRDLLMRRLKRARRTQTHSHNKKTKFKSFQMRNQIMLFTKNLKNARLKKKLFYKFIDFFEIEDVVDTQTYRLRLLDKWRIHLVFHVSLLELYYENENIALSSKMILVEKNEKWEVKKILNHDKE